jgi:hypothetical protein
MAQPAAAGGGRRRPWPLVVLFGATVIYGLTLPFAIVSAVVTPFALDSDSPAVWAYLGGVLSYPVLVVVSLLAGWTLYRARRYRASLLVLLIPLLGSPLLAAFAALTLGR